VYLTKIIFGVKKVRDGGPKDLSRRRRGKKNGGPDDDACDSVTKREGEQVKKQTPEREESKDWEGARCVGKEQKM